MAELITWNTCKLAFTQQYFNTQYEGITILIIAAICLIIHLLLITNPRLTNLMGQYHEQITYVSLRAGVLLVVLFLLYFWYIFKPDMTQAIITNMANLTYHGVQPLI